MNNPFLGNRNSIAIYLGSWIAAGIFHFLWLSLESHYPTEHAVVESITSTLIFMCLGLLVWPLTKYNQPGKADIWGTISSQILGIALVVGAWLLSVTWVLNFFAGFYPGKILRSYITTQQFAHGVSYYVLLFLACYFYLLYIESREKKVNEERMKRLVRESELNMLKAQINPHFLFNSLNSVNYLIGYDPEKASSMLAKLSDYLRYSLRKGDSGLVSFCDELNNCRRFLDIEKMRFGDKMVIIEDIDDENCNVKVPLMILQPLFENAIKHGVYESLEPVTIESKAKVANNMLVIEICNTFDPEAIPRKGEGVGLQNVSDRLELIYGQRGLFKTHKENGRFKATVNIPI
jgi:two-component system, LytTR family, sensor kinase